jgi:mRNA-degrading endonuclease toxin of MazEF toxin-antitoxin module
MYSFNIIHVAQSEGLAKESIINLAQIRTIDKRHLHPSRHALLSSELMKKVDVALCLSLGLLNAA